MQEEPYRAISQARYGSSLFCVVSSFLYRVPLRKNRIWIFFQLIILTTESAKVNPRRIWYSKLNTLASNGIVYSCRHDAELCRYIRFNRYLLFKPSQSTYHNFYSVSIHISQNKILHKSKIAYQTISSCYTYFIRKYSD